MANLSKKSKKKTKVNLLPQEEFASSIFGRVLTWALSTFRIIVILVELVVVVAFLSRFWLDARVTDLNDEIKQKQAIIESQKNFEQDFRAVQNGLKIFTELTREESMNALIQTTASFLPQDTTLVSFSKSEDGVQIKANALAEGAIAQYIANLKSSDSFQEVILSQVDSRADSPLISFTLKATIK